MRNPVRSANSRIPARLLVAGALVVATSAPALAGDNPDVTFVLHAQNPSAGGCNASGQPDCVTGQPAANVPASSQQRIFVYVHNVAGVAGVQTAFRWDPTWVLVSSSWNCQGCGARTNLVHTTSCGEAVTSTGTTCALASTSTSCESTGAGSAAGSS